MSESQKQKVGRLAIKGRTILDPKDSGPIEYAYHLMAKAAGIDVPDARPQSTALCTWVKVSRQGVSI